jgi:hypothetical protein
MLVYAACGLPISPNTLEQQAHLLNPPSIHSSYLTEIERNIIRNETQNAYERIAHIYNTG